MPSLFVVYLKISQSRTSGTWSRNLHLNCFRLNHIKENDCRSTILFYPTPWNNIEGSKGTTSTTLRKAFNKIHICHSYLKSLMDSTNLEMSVLWFLKGNKQRISSTMSQQSTKNYYNACGAHAFLKAISKSRAKKFLSKELHNLTILSGKTPTSKFRRQSKEKLYLIYLLLAYYWSDVQFSTPWRSHSFIVRTALKL